MAIWKMCVGGIPYTRYVSALEMFAFVACFPCGLNAQEMFPRSVEVGLDNFK